ncbi:hypothetical protein CDAR_464501 [Caerostris darwini]|uniref:Uncharacterized protein n=1 Tax=Caerostris darwini TaxID=1538125 RepID=A0AAV4VU47_9ARAC|nr:hypothetical protein CDAR_464501 [Caerostris darwini]
MPQSAGIHLSLFWKDRDLTIDYQFLIASEQGTLLDSIAYKVTFESDKMTTSEKLFVGHWSRESGNGNGLPSHHRKQVLSFPIHHNNFIYHTEINLILSPMLPYLGRPPLASITLLTQKQPVFNNIHI